MSSPPLSLENESPVSEDVFHELRDYLEDETEVDDITPVESTEMRPASEHDDEKAQDLGVKRKDPLEEEEGEKKKETVEEEKPEGLRFGLFFTSLRFKLISIISVIIILSLSGMIFLATYFFKKDNEIRVQESNHKVSEVIALKVSSDIASIIEKSRLIREKLSRSRSSLIPGNEKDFIFLGIAVSSGNGEIKFIDSYYNNSVMELSQISRANIREAHIANSRIFARSLGGGNVIHNMSQGFGVPVIGISIPFQSDARGGARSILVSYIKLDRFLQTFKTTGITKAFLVNDRGDIVAHPDSTVVLSEANFINLPIVEMMTKSTLDNGQTRYRDENGVFHLGSFKKIGIGGCGVIATVDEKKAFQEVYNIQRRNIYLMIVVLTVVIMIVFFFGQSLTTPIIRLVGAAKKIKEGVYNVDIKPATRDEVGELTNAFIEMGAGLEEREKIKTAFGKFVNPELAELVMKDGVRLGGEKKTVVILFSDIRNFTAISEKLDPEAVVDFLNLYMTRMVDCIDSTGGIVDKFIGDAIMAIWGVPLSKGNDTENAIDAALMMRKSLVEFNKKRGDSKNPIIRIGCGINTGPVLAGQIGSENRMEYTVIGDTVNLASRIEDLNKPFGTDILISEDTYNIVRDIYAVERMEPIKVKGKDEPQQIFAIMGRLDDTERPRTIQELRQLLGLEIQPFNRRAGDRDKGEVKYEILEH
jgi:adenylate cyclase